MTITSQVYVGIDVSKDTLDLAVLGNRSIVQFANTKQGIAKLIRYRKPLSAKLMVVEATGGYEQALVLALFAAGMPVALVSPQRVRHCREAACQSQEVASLDRQAGCPNPGRFWKEHPATLVCGKK